MKKAARQETLEEAAIRLENERHTRRLIEIRTISKRLQALQGYTAALAAAGVNLQADQISLNAFDKHVELAKGFMENEYGTAALTVFESHGFKKSDVLDCQNFTLVRVVKGSLRIQMAIEKARAAHGVLASAQTA